MPSALDAYPLSKSFRDRSLREEKHVRASGNVPDEYVGKHVRASRGVTGKMNVNGDLQVKNLGNMRAGQTAYDTGIGWFFGYNGNTPVFSIGDSSPGANKMLWDGTDLSITGEISATTGQIGGWSIGASQLTGGDATLDSAGFLELGTGNDIAKLSSIDATYRIWAGNASPGSAPFSVTKAGALGATSGEVGGWAINPNTLAAVSGNLVLDANAGSIYSGATAFGTGTGWRLEYNSGTPRFRVGTASDERVEWDGSKLTVKGRIEFGTDDYLDNDIMHFTVTSTYDPIIEIEGGTETFNIAARWGGFLFDVTDALGEGTQIEMDGIDTSDWAVRLLAIGDGTTAQLGVLNNLGTGRIIATGVAAPIPSGSPTEGIRIQVDGGVKTLAVY